MLDLGSNRSINFSGKPDGHGRYPSVVPVGDGGGDEGGNTALTGENSAMSYSMTGTNIGDTLTLTAKSGTDFGSTGPIFVMLLDAAQKDGSGNLVPRFGAGTIDTNGAVVSKFESNSAMPGGEGWRMGADDSDFGSTTYPFIMRVDTPSHMKSFEAHVAHLAVDKRIPIRDALAARTDGDGDLWGVKRLWNMAESGAFGDTDSPGSNFFLADQFGWDSNGDRWLEAVEIVGNTKPYTNFTSNIDDPDDVDSPSNYWRPEPHNVEFYYDLGSSDPSVDDSVQAVKFWTADDGKFIDETMTGVNLKNPTETEQTPSGHFTYPGYVRGWNIGLDYNFIENLRYKAVGDGCYCRVAITDSADYFATDKHTILEVSAQEDWTTGQILARLHGGWFDLANLAGYYFNVIGTDNTQIASCQIGSA